MLKPLRKFGAVLAMLLASVAAASEPTGDRVIAAHTQAPQVQYLQRQSHAGEIQLLRIALPTNHFKPVAQQISTRPMELQIVARAGGVVLIGRRVISVERGETSQTLFEEIAVRVPRYRYSMSWDVKALERELERLGVKVKPPAGAPVPRPAPPVTGGA